MDYRFGSGLLLSNTRAEHAEALEELQRIVFPTLADEQRFKAAHYHKHIQLFPPGQFVVLDGETVVGMTSTIRLNFDFDHVNHRFEDIIQGGYLTSHEPDGQWLYGADIGTHPDYRGRGIGRALYAARHGVVRELHLAGQVTVGMPCGYGAVKGDISIDDYYAKIVSGELRDPTISAQQHIGFEPRRVLPDYLDDPVCANYGILLVLEADRNVPWPT